MKEFAQLLLEANVATNFEAFITVAFNGGPSKDSKTLAAARLSPEDYKTYQVPAQKIAKVLKKKFSGQMVHYGADNAAMIAWWKGKGTPKTDNYIGKAHLSLKEAGGSQLLSAKKGEAESTFKAAIAYMGKNAPADAEKLAAKVSGFMKDIVMPKGGPTIGEFTAAVKAHKNVKAALKSTVDTYLKADTGKSRMTGILNKYFEENAEFKRWFTYEAATGATKFQPEPLAMANWVLKFSTDGTVHELEPLSTGGKPTKYIDGLSKKLNLRLSWKTPTSKGNKTYIALRGDIKAMHEGISETMDTLIDEECSDFADYVLLEAIDLGAAFSKVKDFFANLIQKIIDTLKTIASKGYDAILAFLGLEIDSVSASGLEY